MKASRSKIFLRKYGNLLKFKAIMIQYPIWNNILIWKTWYRSFSNNYGQSENIFGYFKILKQKEQLRSVKDI